MPSELIHNEKELLLRISQGDESAMNIVFEAYFGKLVNYSFQLTNDKMEAEDMAMRALGKLWQRSKEQPVIEALDGFLYRTVHNNCIDLIRHERVRGKQQSESLNNPGPQEEYIESNYVRAELVSIIYKEMDNLPEKCREVAKLYFIHGLSHAEIAVKMDIEEKTVRNQKARALVLLRSILIKKQLFHLFLSFF